MWDNVKTWAADIELKGITAYLLACSPDSLGVLWQRCLLQYPSYYPPSLPSKQSKAISLHIQHPLTSGSQRKQPLRESQCSKWGHDKSTGKNTYIHCCCCSFPVCLGQSCEWCHGSAACCLHPWQQQLAFQKMVLVAYCPKGNMGKGVIHNTGMECSCFLAGSLSNETDCNSGSPQELACNADCWLRPSWGHVAVCGYPLPLLSVYLNIVDEAS